MHKRVKLISCHNMLLFIKTMHKVTRLPLANCKCIYDSLRKGGIILLNESSITPEQWEIVAGKVSKECEFKYEYV